MEIFISVIIISMVLIVIMVFPYQNKSISNSDTNDEKLLEEWYCPECGFHVQLGDTCTYCYEEKPQ